MAATTAGVHEGSTTAAAATVLHPPAAVVTLSKEEQRSASKVKHASARKLTKLVASIEKVDKKMHDVETSMVANGCDRGRLQELQQQKDLLEPRLGALYRELEALM